MSANAIISYDINDQEAYGGYVPGVLPLLAKHGAEVIVADWAADQIEGPSRSVSVVLKFPSMDAAKAWYNDTEYIPVRAIRLASCSNGSLAYANEFVMPSE